MTLSSLENKYLDNRIFIIGNGPSLSKTPLEMINGEYSFGMNRIGMIFDKTSWRPTHFLCLTHRVFWSEAYLKDVMRVIDLGIPCFIGERIKKAIGEHSNVHYIKCLHIKNSPKGDWWEDISNGEVSVYGQSLFGAVRIADYLGFNPMYLLGVDGGYKNTGKDNDENHFDPNYEIPKHRAPTKKIKEWYVPRIRKSHKMISRMSKKHNFEIYNASVETKVDTYPVVNLEEIIND